MNMPKNVETYELWKSWDNNKYEMDQWNDDQNSRQYVGARQTQPVRVAPNTTRAMWA